MKTKSTHFILVFSLMLATVANAQWQQTTLNNKTILSMTANSSTVFAGSYTDGVYRSTDDGTTWTLVNTGLSDYAIWGMGVSGDTIYAGTTHGAFRSIDNGDHWTDISNGLAGIYAIYDFAFMGSATLVGTLNNIYKSTDNCANWTYSGSGIVSMSNDIKSMVGNGTSLFAGSYNLGSVYYSADTGATWTSVGLSTYPIRSMGINGANLFVGTSDTIYYSSDNGANWSSRINGISALNKWTLSFAFDGSKVIAGTRGGGVYVSDDNGLNWIFKGTGLPLGSYVNKLVLKGNKIFAGTDYQQGVWMRALSEVTTSVEETKNQSSFELYPNPASDRLTIAFENLKASRNFSINDIAGRTVRVVTVPANSLNMIRLDVSTLDAGIYILSEENSSSTSPSCKMFVIEH